MDNNRLIRIAILLSQVSGRRKYFVCDFEADEPDFLMYPFSSKSAANKKALEIIALFNDNTKDKYRKTLGLDPNDDLSNINVERKIYLPVFTIFGVSEGSEGVVVMSDFSTGIEFYSWPESKSSIPAHEHPHALFPTTGTPDGAAVAGKRLLPNFLKSQPSKP